MEPTPAALGYRLPAEWEAHEATWIAWPHARRDWPGKLAAIHWVYCEIVRKIAPAETVRVLVNSTPHEARARRFLSRVGVDPGRVEFFRIATDRGWTRDFGPAFVRRGGSPPDVAIVRFRFNGWARYADWRRDDAVPPRVGRRLGFRLFHPRVQGRDLVLEGGSIDVNGRGTLLTTEECLLDPTRQARNPGLGREDIEEALRRYLGVTKIVWLGRGLADDDTHGHVDNFCRFVTARTVVLCRADDARDPNHNRLEENRERLHGMRTEDGSRIEVLRLPMPSPLYMDGRRLPASYANFYVSNEVVLVPTFNDPADRVALGLLGEVFPSRTVVGVHAVDLVWGFGAVHCLTREQPARSEADAGPPGLVDVNPRRVK